MHAPVAGAHELEQQRGAVVDRDAPVAELGRRGRDPGVLLVADVAQAVPAAACSGRLSACVSAHARELEQQPLTSQGLAVFHVKLLTTCGWPTL